MTKRFPRGVSKSGAAALLAALAMSLGAIAPGLSQGAIAQIDPTYPSFIDWLRGGGDAPPESGGTRTITRGDLPCLVTPSTSLEYPTAEIYGEHPMFILQGHYERLWLAPSGQKDEVLWSREAGSGLTLATYDQTPLSADQIYHLWIESQQGELRVRLTRLPAATRQRISEELMTLERQARQEHLPAAAAAWRRADYFWQQGLGVDAWGEVAAIAQTSEDSAAALEAGIERFCGAPQPTSDADDGPLSVGGEEP